MTEWMVDAACVEVGPGLFYPRGEGGFNEYDEARKVCGACPVQVDCLEYALEVDDRHGMWGGLTPNERAKVAKGRRRPRGKARQADIELLASWNDRGPRTRDDFAASLGITPAAFEQRLARARRRVRAA
jgi:WhiB family redox-sensing transcriptional regulator